MTGRAHRRIPAVLVACLVLAALPHLGTGAAAAQAVTSLWSVVAQPAVAYGRPVVVTGVLRHAGVGVGEASVEIVDVSGATGRAVLARATTRADGRFTATYTALRGGLVRAEVRSTAEHGAATSRGARVTVQPQVYDVRVDGDPATARAGATRVVTGRLHAGLAGQRVKVERFDGAAWVPAAHSYARADGTFAIATPTVGFGTRAYRVVVPATDGRVVKVVATSIGTYGGLVDRYTSAARCTGAAALDRTGCVPPPSFVAGWAGDTQGAYACYTTAVEAPVRSCRTGSTRPDALRVAVTGDSHAAMLLPGLAPLLTDLNWSLDSYVARGCVLSAPASPADPCRSRLEDLSERLENGRYDVVVVTAYRGDRAPAAPDPRVAAYAQAWERLSDTGTTVVALADNPAIDAATLACVDGAVTDGRGSTAAAEACGVDRADAFERTDPVPAAAAAAHVALVDLARLQCVEERCPAVVGGVMAYRDTHHLSATYTRTLAPYLLESVLEHL